MPESSRILEAPRSGGGTLLSDVRSITHLDRLARSTAKLLRIQRLVHAPPRPRMPDWEGSGERHSNEVQYGRVREMAPMSQFVTSVAEALEGSTNLAVRAPATEQSD